MDGGDFWSVPPWLLGKLSFFFFLKLISQYFYGVIDYSPSYSSEACTHPVDSFFSPLLSLKQMNKNEKEET